MNDTAGVMPAILRLYPELDRSQLELIGHLDGPALGIAGPGAGKTRTISLRGANIVLSGRAKPKQLVMRTDNQRAAHELQQRFRQVVMTTGRRCDVDQVRITTIHQAKGLEWDVVIVGSLGWDKREADPVGRLLRPHCRGEPYEPADRIAEFDLMRQFYVAFSRPRHLLVLTAAGPVHPRFHSILEPALRWTELERSELSRLARQRFRPPHAEVDGYFPQIRDPEAVALKNGGLKDQRPLVLVWAGAAGFCYPQVKASPGGGFEKISCSCRSRVAVARSVKAAFAVSMVSLSLALRS